MGALPFRMPIEKKCLSSESSFGAFEEKGKALIYGSSRFQRNVSGFFIRIGAATIAPLVHLSKLWLVLGSLDPDLSRIVTGKHL